MFPAPELRPDERAELWRRHTADSLLDHNSRREQPKTRLRGSTRTFGDGTAYASHTPRCGSTVCKPSSARKSPGDRSRHSVSAVVARRYDVGCRWLSGILGGRSGLCLHVTLPVCSNDRLRRTSKGKLRLSRPGWVGCGDTPNVAGAGCWHSFWNAGSQIDG